MFLIWGCFSKWNFTVLPSQPQTFKLTQLSCLSFLSIGTAGMCPTPSSTQHIHLSPRSSLQVAVIPKYDVNADSLLVHAA